MPSTLNVITRYMSDMLGHVDREGKHYTGGSIKDLQECHKSGLVEGHAMAPLIRIQENMWSKT